MKYRFKSKSQFVIDPQLISSDSVELLLRIFQDEKIKVLTDVSSVKDHDQYIIFTEKKNLRKLSKIKNKILVLPLTEMQSGTSLQYLNFNSYEDIILFLDNLFISEKILNLKELITQSEKIVEQVKKESFSQHIEPDQLKFYEYLIDLETNILKEPSILKWNLDFKNFSKKSPEIMSFILIKESELLSDDVTVDDQALLVKIPYQDLFLYLRFKSADYQKYYFQIDLILTVVCRTIQTIDFGLVKNDGEIDFWKKIFSKIPYPMAVISGLGDLLIYNESFAKIGILPKECLRYRHHESVEVFHNYYKVTRIDFSVNLEAVSYFIFYTVDPIQVTSPLPHKKLNQSANIDDLGIISSSIAHELNNPLAGILAALSLLSLEEDWSSEALSDLNDMKNGAKRCKELVEIFLGFSKLNPTATEKPMIKDSLDQAINLLRFRMIESNLRLDIKYVPTLEIFSHTVNSSVMSMVLYLIYSELMTAFAHHRLVTQTPQSHLVGEFHEFSNQMILRLDSSFEYEEKIAQSKLIQHLLLFEKLEINFLDRELKLIYRS